MIDDVWVKHTDKPLDAAHRMCFRHPHKRFKPLTAPIESVESQAAPKCKASPQRIWIQKLVYLSRISFYIKDMDLLGLKDAGWTTTTREAG